MQITAKTPQDRIKRQSVVANANASSGCCRSFPSNGNYPPPPHVCSSQMAPGYAVAVMGIDFTLRYFYKVLLDLLPICNQDKGNKIRYGTGRFWLIFVAAADHAVALLSVSVFLILLAGKEKLLLNRN